MAHHLHPVGRLRWAVPTLPGCGSRNLLVATVSARALGHRQPEGTARLLGRFRVSDQVVLILFREMFTSGVNFSDDRIVPCPSCIPGDTSIS